MVNHDKERDIQNVIINILSSLRRSMRFALEQNNVALTPLYFIMLKYIHDSEQCTALLLSERSGRDKGQVTRIIKELEAQQLILKQRNPLDKRSFFLTLTDAGLRCFKELEQYDLDALHAMTDGISAHALEQFLQTADKMAHNLQHYPKQSRD